MPARYRFLTCVLAAAQMSFPLMARAEGGYESDWLIERWNGQWELVTRGAAGRIVKTAANQEVLRMGKNGIVLVMSMPKLAEGETVLCFSGKRHDYRSPCSSAFLDCAKSSDGLYVTLVNGLLGYGMADVRSRLECRIDSSAVLGAAKAVGMISTILPVEERETGVR